MMQRPTSSYVGRSRRRFVTFGGALILAACLTVVKMALVALEINEQSIVPWPDVRGTEASVQAPAAPGTLDDSKFVPWPTFLPEPAAGPADQEDGPATPFGDPVPFDDTMSPGDAIQSFDPSTLTKGQIQALQQLAARRQELEERERLLDIRAELNGRTEERLDEQIKRLVTLKERIEALVTDLDADEEKKLLRLVKIYETMKPKAAAEIFNRLDIAVLLHVVERMKEAKSAVVLGKMDPAVAKRVTTELARRKERPYAGGQGLDG
ncbi:MAG: MotE family protein [Geminicoccaceae bacterium]